MRTMRRRRAARGPEAPKARGAIVFRTPRRGGGSIAGLVRLQCHEVDQNTIVFRMRKAALRERRRSARKRCAIKVELRTSAYWSRARATNISAGGMFVATDHFRSVGSRIDVRLWLPNGMEQIVAQARWIRASADHRASREPRGVGVRFYRLSAGAAKALANIAGVGRQA